METTDTKGAGGRKRKAAKKAAKAKSEKPKSEKSKDARARRMSEPSLVERLENVAHAGRPPSSPAPTQPLNGPEQSSQAQAAALAQAAAPNSGRRDPIAGDPAPAGGAGSIPLPDFEALSKNMARLVEETGKAVAAYVRPMETGKTNPDFGEHVEDAVKTFGHVAEYWLSDPARSLEAQTALSSNFLSLWANTLRRFAGESAPSVAPPDPADKRFADPEWRRNPLFDFFSQAYTLSTQWMNEMIDKADVDPLTREKAQFYARQLVGALSPSNFVATNPELIRETFQRNGENLVRGMQMFAEDIEAGRGQLKIRQTDSTKFRLGVDMAATPGKVVLRNELMELIQYAPSTEQVYKRPLLIVPPWINKFYVLDLNPDKSFVRWAVSQGLTVFVISWVNPDERHAHKSFEDYMSEGIFAALEAIETATGERQVATIGYCVGGTLLAIALAYMALTGDDRISSATLLTTQVDFRDAGDLKLFVDEARIGSIEDAMNARGYLEGSRMASAFNMLRPTELIWNYVVNNYLKGKEPMPFDLLAWNSDSTRMPAANHSFYLRNCYLENKLTKGEMKILGKKLDLGKVTIPIYNLATKEDHIAPARSVYTGAKSFGGDMRYVLAGSGHIAGVVNPVSRPKYQFWTGPQPKGASFEDWLLAAREHKGTWWPDWLGWITAQAPEKVSARVPGGGKLEPLGDAPGDYVRVRS